MKTPRRRAQSNPRSATPRADPAAPTSVATAAAVLLLAWASDARASVPTQALASFIGEAVQPADAQLAAPLLDVEGPYVLVHLATNRVHLMEGARSLWSAPAATGTGFRLAGGGQRWTFSTPKGLFRVRRKEKDPVWVAPDWYFVERGLGVPADNHPSRRIPGAMGNTALYLGDGIAIHGTDRPALVLDPDPERRRVSHGCIRLANESARELYHLVDVGTPVLVF